MNKKALFVLLIVVIFLLLAMLIYLFDDVQKKENEMREIVEMMDFEKELLEKEYENFNLEFDNYPKNIKNDSLLHLLETERIRVQQLLEELRITKATNARRVNELKKELGTVREVMISYIAQIDSLNIINSKLEKENKVVHKKYQVATKTVELLSKEKESLKETVTRASMLEISNFEFFLLNAKGRKTKRLSKTTTIEFNYNIAKNRTTDPGVKTVYLRITAPDGSVLSRDSTDFFSFEDKEIAFSAKKQFEYEGESLHDLIYWQVDENLQNGDYRADFFADGFHIGEFMFQILK